MLRARLADHRPWQCVRSFGSQTPPSPGSAHTAATHAMRSNHWCERTKLPAIACKLARTPAAAARRSTLPSRPKWGNRWAVDGWPSSASIRNGGGTQPAPAAATSVASVTVWASLVSLTHAPSSSRCSSGVHMVWQSRTKSACTGCGTAVAGLCCCCCCCGGLLPPVTAGALGREAAPPWPTSSSSSCRRDESARRRSSGGSLCPAM